VRLTGRSLVPGTAEGPVVALEEPLSFWGGVDPGTGHVIDLHHPQHGRSLAGHVAVLPSGRGSSSSSSVLAEAIRAGTAPAAIVLGETDPILALGAIVARELYGTVVPIVVLDPPAFRRAAQAATLRVDGAAVEPI
jgi:cis-L-3-hydroxyproline dehydratase